MNAEILKYILAIISGISACIPLVIQLVKYVQKASQEKNWNTLVDLVMRYMEEAERKFDDGATRKEWVMAMIMTSASTINYEIDMKAVSELIDSLVAMSKVVNGPDVTVSVAATNVEGMSDILLCGTNATAANVKLPETGKGE